MKHAQPASFDPPNSVCNLHLLCESYSGGSSFQHWTTKMDKFKSDILQNAIWKAQEPKAEISVLTEANSIMSMHPINQITLQKHHIATELENKEKGDFRQSARLSSILLGYENPCKGSHWELSQFNENSYRCIKTSILHCGVALTRIVMNLSAKDCDNSNEITQITWEF